MTIARAEIAFCVVFGCVEACFFGDVAAALIWLCCSFAWLCCDIVEQRYKYICKYADAAKANNDELFGYAKRLKEKLEINEAHHYLTFLRMRLAENDVDFCKRKKSCSEYLSYKQCVEEAIAEAEEKVVEMRAVYKEKYGESSL